MSPFSGHYAIKGTIRMNFAELFWYMITRTRYRNLIFPSHEWYFTCIIAIKSYWDFAWVVSVMSGRCQYLSHIPFIFWIIILGLLHKFQVENEYFGHTKFFKKLNNYEKLKEPLREKPEPFCLTQHQRQWKWLRDIIPKWIHVLNFSKKICFLSELLFIVSTLNLEFLIIKEYQC